MLCLYIDDMLIVDSGNKIIESTKNMLNSRFDMKDMGLAYIILGVKISRTSNGLVLISHIMWTKFWKSSIRMILALLEHR